MSAGHNRSATLRGNLETAIAETVEARMAQVWTNLPVKVVSISGDGKTATLQPLYKPRHNGEAVSMPQLVDVPIEWPRGGGMVMRFPIKSGDKGMVAFMSRSMDDFYETGDETAAPSARMHSLSDGVFRPGLSDKSAPVGEYDNTAFELGSEDGQFKFKMNEAGQFKMEGAQGDIIDLLQELCQKLSSDTLVIKYGSSAGSGHELQFKADYAAIAAKIAAMKMG